MWCTWSRTDAFTSDAFGVRRLAAAFSPAACCRRPRQAAARKAVPRHRTPKRLAYRRGGNRQRRPVLHEDYDADALPRWIGIHRNGLRQRTLTHAYDAPDDGVIGGAAAFVLAALDPRGYVVLEDDQHDIAALRRLGANRDVDLRVVARDLKGNVANRLLSRRLVDSSLHDRSVGADKLSRAVDHHLRRVRRVEVEGAHIHHLALRPQPRRKRIAPTEVIPVIDVKRERDHLPVLLRQLRDQSVRGRAARAALRREQLHDDRE